MKLYLILFLIFSFALFSAQHTARINKTPITSDSVSLKDKAILEQNTKDPENINSNSRAKPETQESVVKEITIVQGLDIILNYKVNRVWREDLYCWVCLKSLKSARVA